MRENDRLKLPVKLASGHIVNLVAYGFKVILRDVGYGSWLGFICSVAQKTNDLIAAFPNQLGFEFLCLIIPLLSELLFIQKRECPAKFAITEEANGFSEGGLAASLIADDGNKTGIDWYRAGKPILFQFGPVDLLEFNHRYIFRLVSADPLQFGRRVSYPRSAWVALQLLKGSKRWVAFYPTRGVHCIFADVVVVRADYYGPGKAYFRED